MYTDLIAESSRRDSIGPSSFLHLLGVHVAAAFLCLTANGQIFTMTQSVNNTTVLSGNSSNCGTPGFHMPSSYWRSYDLTAQGISGDIEIVGIRLGIELARSSLPAGQPAMIQLYADPTPGTPAPVSSLVLLHSEVVTIQDVSLGFLLRDLECAVFFANNGADRLVVEVFVPDGILSGSMFFIGSNSNGQTAPSYFSASACGYLEPTDLALIFPSMHIILDVMYATVGATTQAYRGTCEGLHLTSSVNGTHPTG